MINAYPTLDRGLLKRNPTTNVPLSQDITYSGDIWTYEYNRGFAGGVDERYVVNITNGNGMEIINVNTGKVYNENDGLTYEGTAYEYLFPFISDNGYSATTIKDTTFIVNKNRTPLISKVVHGGGQTPILNTYHYSLLPLVQRPNRAWTASGYNTLFKALAQHNFAPTKAVLLPPDGLLLFQRIE